MRFFAYVFIFKLHSSSYIVTYVLCIWTSIFFILIIILWFRVAMHDTRFGNYIVVRRWVIIHFSFGVQPTLIMACCYNYSPIIIYFINYFLGCFVIRPSTITTINYLSTLLR